MLLLGSLGHDQPVLALHQSRLGDDVTGLQLWHQVYALHQTYWLTISTQVVDHI